MKRTGVSTMLVDSDPPAIWIMKDGHYLVLTPGEALDLRKELGAIIGQVEQTSNGPQQLGLFAWLKMLMGGGR